MEISIMLLQVQSDLKMVLHFKSGWRRKKKKGAILWSKKELVGRKGRGEYSIPDWLSLHWDVIGMSGNLEHGYAIFQTNIAMLYSFLTN